MPDGRLAARVDEQVALRERDERIGRPRPAAKCVDAMEGRQAARREGEVVIAIDRRQSREQFIDDLGLPRNAVFVFDAGERLPYDGAEVAANDRSASAGSRSRSSVPSCARSS